MEWFKSKLPVQQFAEVLPSIKIILNDIENTDQYKIVRFTKIAHDGSINIFLSEDIIKNLPGELKLKYKFQKCAPPSKVYKEEGSSLI